ncbi:MAG: hypothetical protein ACLGGX_06510 [Bdellovibrionia bacterium]
MKKALAENLTMIGIRSQDSVKTLSVGPFQLNEESEVDLITTIESKQGWTSFVFPSRKFALNCSEK